MRPNRLLAAALKKAHLPVPTEYFLFDTTTGHLRFNTAGRIYYGALVGWGPVSADNRISVQELFSLLSENLHWADAAVIMHFFGLTEDESAAIADGSVETHVRAIHELAEFMDQHGRANAAVILKAFAVECSRVHQLPGDPLLMRLRELQRVPDVAILP